MNVQQKLIALAIAGMASSAVMAQSNVTVYGQVDLAVMHATGTSTGTNTGAAAATTVGANRGSMTQMVSGMRSDASKLGFKASESLGSGLKASAVIETSLEASGGAGQAAPAATNGNALLGNHVATIGLEGSFGALSAGRMAVGADFASFDAAGDNTSGTIQYLLYDQSLSRANNTIQYVTPEVAGFTGTYQISMSENQDKVARPATSAGSQSALELAYAQGPLLVKLGQTIARDPNAQVIGTKFTLTNLGASYNLGVATVSGQYVTQRSTAVNGAVAAFDANTWQLGAKVPVGAGLVRVNYVQTDDKRTANADAKSWMLGYDHNLSKRTVAYVGATWVSNKNGATFAATAPNATATAALVDQRTNAVFAGMKHAF